MTTKPEFKTILDYYTNYIDLTPGGLVYSPTFRQYEDDGSMFHVDGQSKPTMSFSDLKAKTRNGKGVLFGPNPLIKGKEIAKFTLIQIERPPEVTLAPGLVLDDKGVKHLLIHHLKILDADNLAACRKELIQLLKDTGCGPVANPVTKISTTAKILNPETIENDRHKLWQKHDRFRVWASLEHLPFGKDDLGAMINIETRFLCQGGSFLIVAPSGIGKSTLVMQMAISWAANRDFFGLKPRRSLRCFLLQGENDDGDVAEMAHGIKDGLALNPTEDGLLRRNFVMKTQFGMSDFTKFTDMLEELIVLHKPEVFFVDPLFAFLAGDFSSQEFGSEIFRRRIDPVLKRTGCILVATHHTPKPSKDTSRMGVVDFSYAGFGTSEMTNWFRAVATLRPEKALPKTFRFIVAKRGTRAGFPNGLPYCLMKHSEKGLFWEDVPSNPIMPPGGQLSKAERAAQKLLKRLNLTEPLTRDQILAKIMFVTGRKPRQAANHWALIRKHFVKVGKEYTLIPPEDLAQMPTPESADSFDTASSVPPASAVQVPAPKEHFREQSKLRQHPKPITPKKQGVRSGQR